MKRRKLISNLVLGVRRIQDKDKRYFYMIMVLWNDESEIIIYRTLPQIREFIANLETIACSAALMDLKEPAYLVNRRNLMGDNRLTIQMKHIQNIIKIFDVIQFYKLIQDNKMVTDFFTNRLTFIQYKLYYIIRYTVYDIQYLIYNTLRELQFFDAKGA